MGSSAMFADGQVRASKEKGAEVAGFVDQLRGERWQLIGLWHLWMIACNIVEELSRP